MPKSKRPKPWRQAGITLGLPKDGVDAHLVWGWDHEYEPDETAFMLSADIGRTNVTVYLTVAQATALADKINELNDKRIEESAKRRMGGMG